MTLHVPSFKAGREDPAFPLSLRVSQPLATTVIGSWEPTTAGWNRMRPALPNKSHIPLDRELLPAARGGQINQGTQQALHLVPCQEEQGGGEDSWFLHRKDLVRVNPSFPGRCSVAIAIGRQPSSLIKGDTKTLFEADFQGEIFASLSLLPQVCSLQSFHPIKHFSLSISFFHY